MLIKSHRLKKRQTERSDRFPVQQQAGIVLLAMVAVMCLAVQSHAADRLPVIVVSTPGPGNLTYLPVELISKIGADRAEGVVVKVRYTGGGAVALRDLITMNSDFAVAGLPAAMSLRAGGGRVSAIAAVSGDPLFVLMVRADLRSLVRSVADLRGRTVAVNTSSLASKTTSQQLAELFLTQNGVPLNEVRIVAGGQSWEAQKAVLDSGVADAVMGDEPFASRLLAAHRVFFLLNTADPAMRRTIPGGGFLHAVVETRDDVITKNPEKAAIMVRIMKRTLAWMAKKTPEEIVRELKVTDQEERRWLVATLKRYPRLYSSDGKFSKKQLDETAIFFRKTFPEYSVFSLHDMISDQWSGSKE